MNTRAYFGLILLSLIAAVGGVLTLIPAAGATWVNVLGYRSLCTFAPAATLFCFSIAGASCIVRASLVKRRFQYGKVDVRPVPVVIVSLLLVAAIVSTFWVSTVKRDYIDGTSTPSVASVPTGTVRS